MRYSSATKKLKSYIAKDDIFSYLFYSMYDFNVVVSGKLSQYE